MNANLALPAGLDDAEKPRRASSLPPHRAPPCRALGIPSLGPVPADHLPLPRSYPSSLSASRTIHGAIQLVVPTPPWRSHYPKAFLLLLVEVGPRTDAMGGSLGGGDMGNKGT